MAGKTENENFWRDSFILLTIVFGALIGWVFIQINEPKFINDQRISEYIKADIPFGSDGKIISSNLTESQNRIKEYYETQLNKANDNAVSWGYSFLFGMPWLFFLLYGLVLLLIDEKYPKEKFQFATIGLVRAPVPTIKEAYLLSLASILFGSFGLAIYKTFHNDVTSVFLTLAFYLLALICWLYVIFSLWHLFSKRSIFMKRINEKADLFAKRLAKEIFIFLRKIEIDKQAIETI